MPRDPMRYANTDELSVGFATGMTADTLTVLDNDGTTRVFSPGAWLGSKHPRHGFKYRFDQVHIGDNVMVGYNVVDGVNVAEQVCIRRRPGGKMPVEPWTSEDAHWPWHMAMQAQQDFAEKGTPMPPHLRLKNKPGFLNGVIVPKELLTPPGGAPKQPAAAPPPKLIDN